MLTDQVWLEAAKLAAQIIAALLVGRMAVRWALERYKSEKRWERKLTSYVETVASVSELRLIAGQWIDQLGESVMVSYDKDTKMQERYQSAKRRLDEATATALLLLPASTSSLLTELDREIEKTTIFKDRFTFLNHQYSLLDDALASLIELGQSDLR